MKMTFFSSKLILLIPLFVIGIFGFADVTAETIISSVIILPLPDASLITNGSFEDVTVSDHDGRWQTFTTEQIPGWMIHWNESNEPSNCADTPKVEIHHEIFGGASDGVNYAELDSQCDSAFLTSVIIQQTVNVNGEEEPSVEHENSYYYQGEGYVYEDEPYSYFYAGENPWDAMYNWSAYDDKNYWGDEDEYYWNDEDENYYWEGSEDDDYVLEFDEQDYGYWDDYEEEYELSWYAKKRPGTSNDSNGLLVFVNDIQVSEITLMSDKWTYYNYNFTTNETFITVSFADIGTPDKRGTFLDDVRLVNTYDTENNLLKNGSFDDVHVEYTSKIFTSDDKNIGWSISWNDRDGYTSCPYDGGVEIINDSFGGAKSGKQFAELDSECYARPATSAVIQQTVKVIPGEQYELTWDSKKRPMTVNRSNALSVLVDYDTISYISPMSKHWETSSYTFTAINNTVTISFSDEGYSDSRGTFVDNVILKRINN